jgi:2'-5' RNA ligase
MSSASGANEAAQRLFFALWPNARLQGALYRAGQSLRKALGGRLVPTENIHLTLAFLGSVPAARIDELLGIGAAVMTKRFEMTLTETGCWKRSAVGWIAPGRLPEPLEDLVLALRSRLLAARFRVDEKPFAPHVTLLRKAKCQTPSQHLQAPLNWRVDHFVLVRSVTLRDGPQYAQIGTWPLCY